MQIKIHLFAISNRYLNHALEAALINNPQIK